MSLAEAPIETVPATSAPALGLVSEAVGEVESIWTSWLLTASALPTLSNARYLTVLVAFSVKGAE